MQNQEEMLAELERLRAENQQLKSAPQRRVYLKISNKGAVSLYGLGRFPTTLYVEQWETVLAMADEIRTFMAQHASELKRKPEPGSE
ncbi:MAG: hypothetical protein QOF51_3404 [Chloroflexota bacterium]|jgi:hypothetical protein|nr:hypothetical protein [Chloroflexota bacterium]